jgi:hypothetical protein
MEAIAAGFVALLAWIIQTASDAVLLVLVALIVAGIWTVIERWRKRRKS